MRGMFDFAGKPVDVAGPAMPVEVLGLGEVPQVGAVLGEEAKTTVAKDQLLSLVDRLRQDDSKTLKVVIKADKQGSLEAIEDSLNKFNKQSLPSGKEEKMVDIALAGVGDINESDIKLAAGIKAIVVGFNVKMAPTTMKLAENEHVLVRSYNIIYEMLDEMEDVVEGMLRPGKIEEVLARAEIIAEFPYGKNEKIAGCRVLEGIMAKGPKLRLVRSGEVVGESKIKSLQKVKEEVQKVEKGADCGIMFEPAIDFQIGDFVESFRVI